jgi:ribonuclease HII
MIIVGVDEVGRGPLAGPVVATAAAFFSRALTDPRITDSKKLSPSARAELVPLIQASALAIATVAVGHRRIDKINIRNATKLAMEIAVKKVVTKLHNEYPTLEILIQIDGNMKINCPWPQETVIKGDSLVREIGAASIIAKEHRDQMMRVLDQKYPGYALAKHAGYPTAAHRAAIEAIGPSPIHRRSFAGVILDQAA